MKPVVLTLGLGALILSMGGVGAARAAARPQQGGDLTGFWTLTTYKGSLIPARQRIPQTVEGGPPALLPDAAKLYEQRLKASDAGDPFVPLSGRCLTNGMPLMMMADSAGDRPMQIIQSPGQVTMLFELYHVFRTVRLGGTHPADLDPGFIGDSVGRWEGKTLVVDTVGIKGETTIDMAGMPHSEALHVVERMRKTDADTMEDLITIDDPQTFAKPWTTRMIYKRTKSPIQEYFCDNVRDIHPGGR